MLTKNQIKEYVSELEKVLQNKDCGGGDNKDLSVSILKGMNISDNSIKDFFGLLGDHGGYCDCEIIFNAKDYIERSL